LIAEVAQPDCGAPADIGALLTAQSLDQRRDCFCRVLFSVLQETSCYDSVTFIARIQIPDQLVGRFPATPGARQQAKQKN
jgi:hypothetical protein